MRRSLGSGLDDGTESHGDERAGTYSVGRPPGKAGGNSRSRGSNFSAPSAETTDSSRCLSWVLASTAWTRQSLGEYVQPIVLHRAKLDARTSGWLRVLVPPVVDRLAADPEVSRDRQDGSSAAIRSRTLAPELLWMGPWHAALLEGYEHDDSSKTASTGWVTSGRLPDELQLSSTDTIAREPGTAVWQNPLASLIRSHEAVLGGHITSGVTGPPFSRRMRPEEGAISSRIPGGLSERTERYVAESFDEMRGSDQRAGLGGPFSEHLSSRRGGVLVIVIGDAIPGGVGELHGVVEHVGRQQ